MTDKNSRSSISPIHALILGYPFRVWIYSIFVSPQVAIVYTALTESDYSMFSLFGIILYFFILAGLTAISVPAMVIHVFLFTKLVDSRLSPILIKLILMLTAVTCLSLTGWLVSGTFPITSLVFNNPYETTLHLQVVIAIMSFVFKLKDPD
jgi:hypothetical protein